MKGKKKKINLLVITASISTSLVLLLIGIITLLLLSAGKFSSDIREDMTVEIVLRDEADVNDVRQLQTELQLAGYTRECTFISKEQALAEISSEMGTDPTEFLQFNPFYASLNMKLKAEYANSDSLANIIPLIKKHTIVRELNYQRELLDAVNTNIRKVSVILSALVLILLLISVTLINNIIKLTIYSQRFILYSMKLVGAKWSFIRRPFVLQNMWIGLVSGLITCLVIYLSLKFGGRYEPGLMTVFNRDMLLPVFATVIVTGLLITLLCARISVNRFLRMKSGELYYI